MKRHLGLNDFEVGNQVQDRDGIRYTVTEIRTDEMIIQEIRNDQEIHNYIVSVNAAKKMKRLSAGS